MINILTVLKSLKLADTENRTTKYYGFTACNGSPIVSGSNQRWRQDRIILIDDYIIAIGIVQYDGKILRDTVLGIGSCTPYHGYQGINITGSVDDIKESSGNQWVSNVGLEF